MSAKGTIELTPIGFVRTNAARSEVKKRRRISKIVIRKDLAQALDGLRGFSHLFIIFWMHEIPENQRRKMRVHPRGRKDMPLLGVFATRTPYRPNPLGLTLVELLEIKENVLTIRGLDAFDGTPILDIKPFDAWDAAEEVKIPKWWMKLEKQIST